MNWENIGKYAQIVLFIAIIAHIFTPTEYKNKVYSESLKLVYSYKINCFNDAEVTDVMLESIYHTILKVENSNNIINKEFVIKRLQDVKIKHYERTILFGDNYNNMMYFFDYKNNIDFILLFDSADDKISLIHELNHLIDKHKKDKIEVEISKLLKNVDKEKYLEYFKDWKKLDKIELKRLFREEYTSLLPDKEFVSIGDIYYIILSIKKEYYIENDAEIYARLSSLKAFLVDKGFLEIGDKLDNEVVEYLSSAIKELISTKNWSTEDVVTFLSLFDFVIYFPIINYDKIDDINLIVINDYKLYFSTSLT